MKPPIDPYHSGLHLQNVRRAIEFQEVLIGQHAGDDDKFMKIAERVLLGLKVTAAMMERQNELILERSFGDGAPRN